MNQPQDPQDARPPRKDEGPSQQDIDRSWSDVSGGGKSGGWTDRWWQILITVVGIVIVGSLVITVLPFRSRSANVQPLPEVETGTVVRVIDGRTIFVRVGKTEVEVRYIGVATPEYGHPWYELVTEVNRNWVVGKDVEMERDRVDSDAQGRLLRYVYVDGAMVNAALIAVGLGSKTTGQNVRYSEGFLRLEAEARSEQLGIWAIEEEESPTPSSQSPDRST